MKDKLTFKISDELKVGLTACFDVLDSLTAAEQSDIKFGLSAELKI